MKSSPVVFDYNEFRPFLQDSYVAEKENVSGVTLSGYAAALDLSASSFQMIVSGARNLTQKSVHRVARAMRMTTEERNYFESLVFRDQAEDAETREFYESRLALYGKKSESKRLRVSDRSLVSDWALPALLIYIEDFEKIESPEDFEKLSAEKISTALGIELGRVKSLLDRLKSLGFAEALKDTRGKHLFFDRVSQRRTQKDYVREVIKETAIRAESNFDQTDTVFNTFVFTLPENKLTALREDVNAIFDKYMVGTPNGEEQMLAQAVVGIFPVFKGRPVNS